MRVLVCDDDPAVLQSVGEYLELRGLQVDYCSSGRETVELARRNQYDVIVLDVMMPAKSGLETCRELRSAGGLTPILFLTARDSLDDVLEGFGAGGDDYLVKPFAYPELLARVTALSHRLSRQGSASITVGDLVLDLQLEEASRRGRKLGLNRTQFRLLKCLALNSPGVVTRVKLEEELWGDDVPESDALRTHVFHLRSIVDKPFENGVIHTVHGVGYCLRAPGHATDASQ